MNKIYKIVFNRRLGNFVVVSELIKSAGKSTSCRPATGERYLSAFCTSLKVLSVAVLLTLGTVQTVKATESVVLPLKTNVTLVANADGSYSITTNNNTKSVGQIETDPNRKTTYDTSLKLNGFGILQNRYDGSNELPGVLYLSGVGLGSDVTVGNADSIAIGRAAVAESFAHDKRKGAIALGANSKATKRAAIALGWNTRAMYSGAVAIGGGNADTSARAGWDSISLGFNMNTEGARNTVGIGSKSTAQGEGNIFLASESSLKGKDNIVIGSQSKVNGQHNAGRYYEASGSKYLGTDYQVWDDISNNVLIGARNTVNGGGSADFTTRNAVFGSNNTINSGVKDSVVIGSGVTVDASNTVYIGSGSQAKLDADGSTAGEMGMTAFTDTKFTTIFGTTKFAGSGAKDRGVVTVGKQGAERLIQYVAPGLIDEKSTDAINGSQLYQVITHSLSQLEVGTDASGTSTDKITLKPDSYRFDIVGQNGVTTAVKDKVVNVGLQQATLTATNGAVTASNSDSNYTGDDSYATAGSVATAITDAIAQTTQQYQGDNAKDSEDKDIIVKRKSSDILKITSGASDVSSNNNIGVTANAKDGTLTLRLAKSLDLGSDGKLTIGNASMANDSIKVGGSTLNKDGLTATNVTATTVTGGTLRVGDKTNGVAVLKATREGESSPVLQFGDSTTLPTYLTNVAAGKNDTDAVNYKQLKDLETSLTTTMGGGLTFAGNTSETWKRNLGDTVTIKGGFELQKDETYTDKTTDKNTYVALEKDEESKESLVVRLAKELRDLTSAEFKTVVKNDDSTEKITAITKVDGSGITITPNKKDGTPDTDKTVSLTVKGLNNGGNKITNVADGEIKAGSTDAINGGQLYQYQQATNTAVAQARTQVTGTGVAIVTKTTTDGRDSYNVHV